LSRQAGVIKISIFIAKLHNTEWVKPEELIIGSRNRKDEAENTDRDFVQKTSGMSNEQLKGFAVVGTTGE
jgi:hypothetical protein